MRTIKFRAWDNEEKEMLEDICTNTDDFTDMLNETFAYWQNSELGNNLELMQFTGLLDKNGKEIYEGDILACRLMLNDSYTLNYQVIFKNGAFTINGYPVRRYYESEVIGNVYEQPNLLK